MSNEKDQQSDGQSRAQVGGTSTGAPLSKEAMRLFEVLGRTTVRVLAIISFVGVLLLSSIAVFKPTLVMTSQMSRFFLCLLTAFLLSLFLFPLFPAAYTLNIKKWIGTSLTLVGPVALWIGLFMLLWRFTPSEDVVGKVFLPKSNRQQLAYSTSWILRWDPDPPPMFYKLKLSPDQNSTDPNLAAGFYVQFDKSHDRYTALVGTGPSNSEISARYKLSFSRNASTYEAKELTEAGDEHK